VFITHNFFNAGQASRLPIFRLSGFFRRRLRRRRAGGTPALRSGNKKAPTHEEKGRQNGCASLLIFPKPMMLELELAPDIENKFNRLPWCHRASPSTTRHESVKSTDADKLISNWQSVNWIFQFQKTS
jgi:hypothetical protein